MTCRVGILHIHSWNVFLLCSKYFYFVCMLLNVNNRLNALSNNKKHACRDLSSFTKSIKNTVVYNVLVDLCKTVLENNTVT